MNNGCWILRESATNRLGAKHVCTCRQSNKYLSACNRSTKQFSLHPLTYFDAVTRLATLKGLGCGFLLATACSCYHAFLSIYACHKCNMCVQTLHALNTNIPNDYNPICIFHWCSTFVIIWLLYILFNTTLYFRSRYA